MVAEIFSWKNCLLQPLTVLETAGRTNRNSVLRALKFNLKVGSFLVRLKMLLLNGNLLRFPSMKCHLQKMVFKVMLK